MTHYTGTMAKFEARILVTLVADGEIVSQAFATNDTQARQMLARWIGVNR